MTSPSLVGLSGTVVVLPLGPRIGRHDSKASFRLVRAQPVVSCVADIVKGMPITIRRAVPGDEAALHRLAERTFGLACPPGTPQSDVDAFVALHLSEARFAEYLTDPDRVVLLAVGDDGPVGYTMLVRGPITDADVRALVDAETSVELSKFYVLLDRHGSGIAAELMRATLDAAAGTGAATVWLGVNQRNERAARFYAKNGFDVIGTKRFLVGDTWHDDHVRLRKLIG
jgi:GNAT superfamily N-acetyltransferase